MMEAASVAETIDAAQRRWQVDTDRVVASEVEYRLHLSADDAEAYDFAQAMSVARTRLQGRPSSDTLAAGCSADGPAVAAGGSATRETDARASSDQAESDSDEASPAELPLRGIEEHSSEAAWAATAPLIRPPIAQFQPGTTTGGPLSVAAELAQDITRNAEATGGSAARAPPSHRKCKLCRQMVPQELAWRAYSCTCTELVRRRAERTQFSHHATADSAPAPVDPPSVAAVLAQDSTSNSDTAGGSTAGEPFSQNSASSAGSWYTRNKPGEPTAKPARNWYGDGRSNQASAG